MYVIKFNILYIFTIFLIWRVDVSCKSLLVKDAWLISSYRFQVMSKVEK